MITIRDVTRVAGEAVSTLGTADLRDAALDAASRLAPPDATRDELARIAAALLVHAAGGDRTSHDLPPLSRDQLARAGEPFAKRKR